MSHCIQTSAPSKKGKPSAPKGGAAPAKAKRPEGRDMTEAELSVNKGSIEFPVCGRVR